MSAAAPRLVVRLAAAAALAAAALGLWRLGDGSLSVPLGSPDQLIRWAQGTPPPLMAIAVLRLAALGACAYLALTMSLWVLADAAGWRRLARLVARALPATVRCAASGSAQVSLAAGVVVGVAGPVTAAPGPLGGGPPPPTATMWLLGGDGDRPGAASASATMVLLPPGDPATRPQPTASSPEPPAASPEPEPTPISPEVTAPPRPAMDPAAARAAVDTWEVGAGDCFWSIAESIVAETTGHAPPSEQATSDYWSRLVAANRDRLAAPDHPDLLIPGQILVIPQPS